MEVKAIHKNARVAVRKVRNYRGVIKGLAVEQALAQLKFLPGKVPQLLSKVLQSAVANATNNHELKREELVVAEVIANAGFALKRFRPVSKGRAHGYTKKTTHITVVVEPQVK
jgi:large subunit ribosomal protein L22